jgi:hypothetical protein
MRLARVALDDGGEMIKQRFWPLMLGSCGLILAVATTGNVSAHCDGLDGPVVTAARSALASGKVNLALIWVQPGDEAEIRAVFNNAASVRKLGPAAQQLADRQFFETLVRLHRVGEGAAYSGLKPAGQDLGPAIPAADRAIDTDDLAKLEELLSRAVQTGLHQRYEKVMTLRKYDSGDLRAGREYVAAYVEFIHYVERMYESAGTDPHGHYTQTGR